MLELIMEDKITELNNLYKPVIDSIKKLSQYLGSRCIGHALTFSNNHHIKIGNEVKSVQYPIPCIICELGNIKTKIGLDLATGKDYIGFVKFTISKEQFEMFDFNRIKPFKFEIYGFYFCEEVSSYEKIAELRTDIINSKETTIYVKIKVASLEDIISIIDNLTTIPQKRFSMTCYTCDCGQQITIDRCNGRCLICGEDSRFRRKFDKKCPVCKFATLVDKYGNGECENCGWDNNSFGEERPNEVVYPNLISLNKARKLYNEGKPLRPDLNDFLEGLYFYSEMEFSYKGLDCCLFLTHNSQGEIEFGWEQDQCYYYLDKDVFIQNAKIGDEYVRDIWNEVENPRYM